MPLRAGQVGGSRRLAGFAIPSNPANLQSIRFNFTTNQWEFVTVTGELNTMTNVGAGPGFIFRNKIGVNFNIKSLINGTNMTILNNVDDITISTLAEINLAANVGAGAGLIFRDKIGVTLNLKSLIAGAGITIVDNADDITITSSVAAGLGDLEFLRDAELSGDLLLAFNTRSTVGVGASIVPASGKTFFIVAAQISLAAASLTQAFAQLRNNGTIIDTIATGLNANTEVVPTKSIIRGDSLIGNGAAAFDLNINIITIAVNITTTLEGWIQNT